MKHDPAAFQIGTGENVVLKTWTTRVKPNWRELMQLAAKPLVAIHCHDSQRIHSNG